MQSLQYFIIKKINAFKLPLKAFTHRKKDLDVDLSKGKKKDWRFSMVSIIENKKPLIIPLLIAIM